MRSLVFLAAFSWLMFSVPGFGDDYRAVDDVEGAFRPARAG